MKEKLKILETNKPLIFPKQKTAYCFIYSVTCFVHILIYFYVKVCILPCLNINSCLHTKNINPFKMKQGRNFSEKIFAIDAHVSSQADQAHPISF